MPGWNPARAALCGCGRNIIIPDVIVRKAGRSNGTSGQQNFIVSLNPDVMPRLRVHDIYAGALRGGKGRTRAAKATRACSSACKRRAGSSRTSSSGLTPSCASRAPSSSGKELFTHGELAMRPLVLRDIADELGLHDPPSAA